MQGTLLRAMSVEAMSLTLPIGVESQVPIPPADMDICHIYLTCPDTLQAEHEVATSLVLLSKSKSQEILHSFENGQGFPSIEERSASLELKRSRSVESSEKVEQSVEYVAQSVESSHTFSFPESSAPITLRKPLTLFAVDELDMKTRREVEGELKFQQCAGNFRKKMRKPSAFDAFASRAFAGDFCSHKSTISDTVSSAPSASSWGPQQKKKKSPLNSDFLVQIQNTCKAFTKIHGKHVDFAKICQAFESHL